MGHEGVSAPRKLCTMPSALGARAWHELARSASNRTRSTDPKKKLRAAAQNDNGATNSTESARRAHKQGRIRRAGPETIANARHRNTLREASWGPAPRAERDYHRDI